MAQSSIPNLVCYFARHGERMDHIESTWSVTASAPFDPPLSKEGFYQAKATGVHIADIEYRLRESEDEMVPTEVHFITSPFKRCVQTALQIGSGLNQRNQELLSQGKTIYLPDNFTLNVEPGIGEWMSVDYAFIEQATSAMVVSRKVELSKGFNEVMGRENSEEPPFKVNLEYKPARNNLATFPETFGELCKRIHGTFESIISGVLSNSNLTTTSRLNDRTRTILIFITHGAVIKPLLYYTVHKYALPNIHYCCLSRIHVQDVTDSEDTQTLTSCLSWKTDLLVTTSHL